MASPVIDENVMLKALKAPEPEQLSKNTFRLRTGATLLLLDAFDRKVTRDQFIAALGATVELTDMLGRYEVMLNVRAFEQAHGGVTKADIEVTLARVVDKIAAVTEQCASMANLVHQCPLDEDRVH